MKKKILITILISLMLFIGGQKITNTYAEENKKMISFGDSITYGYLVENNVSYVKLFAQNQGYNLTDYSVVGMDSKELYELVSTTEIDYNVDLITLWFGGNDFLKAMDNIAQENEIDINNLSVEDYSKVKTLFASDNFRNKMQKVIDNYKSNFDKILNHIKQNSSCDIYIFNQYNPYTGISIINPDDNSIFNLGLYTEEWILKLNECMIGENIKLIDTFTLIEKTPDCINANVNVLTGEYNLDPHPNLKGQNTIYNEFLKVYNAKPKEPDINNGNNSVLIPVIIIISSILVLSSITIAIILLKKNQYKKFNSKQVIKIRNNY